MFREESRWKRFLGLQRAKLCVNLSVWQKVKYHLVGLHVFSCRYDIDNRLAPRASSSAVFEAALISSIIEFSIK